MTPTVCPSCGLPLAWLSGLIGKCQSQHTWIEEHGVLVELRPANETTTKTPEELFLDEVAAREPWPFGANPHGLQKVPFAYRPAIAAVLQEWAATRATQEERARLVNAAKRNHNTAQQVRDLLLYGLDPETKAAFSAELLQQLENFKEDAHAAEAEARTQLETLRGWFSR